VRILLVEDEPKMLALLRSGLAEEGIRADLAGTVADASWQAQAHDYDAVVLDLVLPDGSGLEVCRAMRAAGDWTPVLVLTALGTVRNRVAGLDAGADDYLAKPFAFDELLARLRALTRRPAPRDRGSLSVGDLRLDPAARRVWRGDVEVCLTGQEFELLAAMARRPGKVLSRDQLFHLAWDMAAEQRSNVVDACVKGLRDRVDRPFGRNSLQTVRGIGYRLAEDGG
jgi:two-component system, OmpR family, response regulator